MKATTDDSAVSDSAASLKGICVAAVLTCYLSTLLRRLNHPGLERSSRRPLHWRVLSGKPTCSWQGRLIATSGWSQFGGAFAVSTSCCRRKNTKFRFAAYQESVGYFGQAPLLRSNDHDNVEFACGLWRDAS